MKPLVELANMNYLSTVLYILYCVCMRMNQSFVDLPQQDDTDVESRILNVSFSARRPDVHGEEFYPPQHLREKVYLHRANLAKLATVQVKF